MTAQRGHRKEKHFIIATAGHVDHGKSALVKALTGTDPDRLPEEQRRQITIDLGFAELDLGTANGERVHAGVVDVPGHEDFVRNMIAGVGSIDLALFVVAADDGWMPQTEEHFQILTYLGVQRIIMSLSKSDLGNVDGVTAQIREELRGTPFINCQIVPTSVRTGEGITDLKNALARELGKLRPQRDIAKPRLFVDRAFTLRGAGTVVTGTLNGGSIRRGDEVYVQPRNIPARVRSIQNHGRDVEIAEAGMRTAMNVPDLSIGESGIQRGDLITVQSLGSADSIMDVLVHRSARPKRNSAAPRAIRNGSSVQVHFGTSRIAAKITFLDVPALAAGQSAIAQLRLDAPVLAFVDDRFVIRDSSEQNTIAGGRVLDPDGDRAKFRCAGQVQFLRARAAAPLDPAVCIQSQLARDGFAESKTLLLKSNFSAAEVGATVTRLAEEGALISRSVIVGSAKKWRELCDRAAAFIEDAHRKNPERCGVELIDLRGRLGSEPAVFEGLVEDLCKSGFVRVGTAIARKSHRASLPPQIRPTAEKIRAALGTNKLNPPSRKELARDRESQAALRFLIEQAEITDLDGDIVLLSNVSEKMRETVIAFISKHGPATASELRQELGTSRRIVIPFLESLDRAGVTRRVGDKRALGRMM